MRSFLLLLATLTLTLTSCAGGTDPKAKSNAGYSALQQGEFEVALAEFDAALEVIAEDASHPQYLKAKLGRIEALAATDPAQANIELTALAQSMPDKINEADYYAIGGRMMSKDNLTEAVALLTEGMKRYPDSKNLVILRDRAGKRAEDTGDSGALASLKGLGYVGK